MIDEPQIDPIHRFISADFEVLPCPTARDAHDGDADPPRRDATENVRLECVRDENIGCPVPQEFRQFAQALTHVRSIASQFDG